MNEDPEAPNYDAEKKIIRSIWNGSKGPMLEKATVYDWVGDPVPEAARREPGVLGVLGDLVRLRNGVGTALDPQLRRTLLVGEVDRLVDDGLVERSACASDARGAEAVLTDRGLARLRAAAKTHLRGVDEHFLSPIAAADRDGLVRALEAIVRGSRVPGGTIPPACDKVAEALEP